MPSDDTILSTQGLHRHFGGLRALDGVDLAIRRGRLTGLIGPNGAGKTTLFNVLAGFLRPTSGRVLLDGREIQAEPAHRRARAGLVRTFQITRTLARLTVLENLLLACRDQMGEHVWAPLFAAPQVRLQEAELAARAADALEFFELAPLADEYAGALSGGQKKLLELARALMTEPRVVLLDEPLAGVNPSLGRKILDKMAALRRDRGITLVLVEHDLETVFGHCDPIVVMAAGKILAEGDAESVRNNPAVVEAYLGGGAA